MRRRIAIGLILIVAAIATPAARAQFDGLSGKLRQGGNSAAPTPVTVTATILPPQDKQPLRLAVTAKIAQGWHIYSLTQPAGGSIPSQLKFDESADYQLGEFQPEKATGSSFRPGRL